MIITSKRFIVSGTPTGGKSTFSNELVKRHFVKHICIDPIIEAFEDVFPQLGITHNAHSLEKHVEVCQKFNPFIQRMIDGMDIGNFVVEGFRLPIKDLYEKYGSAGIQFFVFGYPNSTPEQKLEQIKKYDCGKGNWVDHMSDQELLEIFEFLIAESKLEENLCKKFGIPFFDTANDFNTKINEALNLVK
jgi:hypothetical protein